MEFRNHVQLVGRLGSDPMVRETKNGKVARFSIATNEQYSENLGTGLRRKLSVISTRETKS